MKKAVQKMPPEVISVVPSLSEDWNGDLAAFFDVTLPDSGDRDARLKLSREITWAITSEVEPMEEWGVWPNFNWHFRNIKTETREATLA